MNSTELAIPPTRDDLARLAGPRSEPVVSLLVPPTPRDEGRIQMRNLAGEAVALLEQSGMRPVEARERMAIVDRILHEHQLWATPEVALAVYVTSDESWRTAGPTLGGPQVVVGPRAQIKHLLDCTPHPAHAVLTLSLKSSHLYRADHDGLVEVEAESLPVTMAEVLKYDDPEPQLQVRSVGNTGGGGTGGVFHGHGGKETRDEEIARYLRAVTAAVEKQLDGEPLVIAGTDEVVAAFRKITGYDRILERDIPGSGERHTATDLRAGAAEIVDEAMDRHRSDVRTRIVARLGTDVVAVDLPEVVLAACEGRMEALFVAGGETTVKGRYEPGRRIVELAEDGEDLVNLAAVETWNHHGEVFVVPGDDVPGVGVAAGLIRS
jgi:hypothetical protein